MECKVSDLVKRGHDQAAELKSSCGAVDVRDVAQLISDLATQLDVQLVRSNALAAEYARLSDIAKGGAFVMQKALMKYEFGVGMTMQAEDFIRDVRSKTPATDAFLAEVRAQGVERYAAQLKSEAELADEAGWDGAAKFLISESEKVLAFAAQIITALLDELEHYKSREWRVAKLVLDNSTSWDVLYEKLEAAEKRIAEQREYYEGVIADGSKRIAELEAKLETADKLQDSAFRDGLKAGFSYGQTDDQSGFAQCMSAYSTRAGIGVKQQEDSVDSDVGRNQPGMVVAVHIDAGDFVKVKGQVFEVEETDFDDHDVTLWFVGGNALKCAAGCQVEVVSAPVAAGIKVKG